MHRIKAHQTGVVHVGQTPVSITEALDMIAEARQNKKTAIEGASSIEAKIGQVIVHHFFPERTNERRRDFELMIVRSDWCSFAAKRKLLVWIIDSRNLLQGAEKAVCDKLLKDAMAIRNALVHGELSSDAKTVFLSYFEGSPRRVELTDDYWRGVERTLKEAFSMMEKLSEVSGTTKMVKGPVAEDNLAGDSTDSITGSGEEKKADE